MRYRKSFNLEIRIPSFRFDYDCNKYKNQLFINVANNKHYNNDFNSDSIILIEPMSIFDEDSCYKLIDKKFLKRVVKCDSEDCMMIIMRYFENTKSSFTVNVVYIKICCTLIM